MDELLERNRNLNRGFRKLRVWVEAVELYGFEKTAIDRVRGISFKIEDQVLGSAFSISSNIAEGYCRKSIREYIQFVNIALGSCGENYSQFYTLLKSTEKQQMVFDEFNDRHFMVENKLLNLARALSGKMKPDQNWNSNFGIP